MNPVLGLGANIAISGVTKATDNFIYVSCIRDYESEMIKWASADVLKSRPVMLRHSLPVRYFDYIIRNSVLKLINTLLNIYSFVTDNFIFKD